MTDDYEGYLPGDPDELPVIDGAVEVYLRGPAVDVAAVRGWIVARAGMDEVDGWAEHRTTDRGGAVCRMVVMPAEER
jgi:hypothetical protein